MGVRLKLPDPPEREIVHAFGILRSQMDVRQAYFDKLSPKTQELVDGLLNGSKTYDLRRDFSNNPEATLSRIENLPQKEKGAIDVPYLFKDYARLQPAEALELARKKGTPETLQNVVGAIVKENSNASLQERQQILLDHLASTGNANGNDKLVDTLMQQFGQRDPAAGIKTCDSVPEGPLREAAVTSLARSWSALDPVAASEWMAQMPEGRPRDLAVRQLVAKASDDPEMALLNAKAISNPALRMEASREVMNAWRALNPDRILEFARAAGFSKEEIAALAQPPQPPPALPGK
jgi:NADH dehydrogenase/NADH:ubiquinone oxidoreductase subunit G